MKKEFIISTSYLYIDEQSNKKNKKRERKRDKEVGKALSMCLVKRIESQEGSPLTSSRVAFHSSFRL